MRESKVHFGIGTDSLASNSSIDPLVEIRFLKDIQGGFSDKELLRMITINSTEILCLDQIIGSIEKGEKADLVVMNFKKEVDPSQVYRYLIDEGGKEDVLISLVDGKMIFERGEA